MKQKLITIALWSTDSKVDGVHEHLGGHFEDGWKVVSMVPVGAGISNSSSGTDYGHRSVNMPGWVGGWLAVLLEKQ